MIIFKRSQDLRNYVNKIRSTEVSIGFVPTMGALHPGHLSLIEESKKRAQVTICSIFINRVQFNNPDDFDKYPVSIEKDIQLLEEQNCSVLFLPQETEIYPDPASLHKHFELGYLETILEGKFRPGHFQGVCLVVERLLNIVNPDFLFIGQKDFQQCLVIKNLITMMKKDIQVIICPIFRESTGLAMSSRNLRLNSFEKKLAPELHLALEGIKENLSASNFSMLKNEAILHLEKLGFKIDYLELAKAKSLELVKEFDNKEDHILLIAAFLNEVRLIDNLLING